MHVMIVFMRKIVRSKISTIFIYIALLTMAFSSVVLKDSKQKDDWVIKVYKKTLTNNKYQEILQSIKKQEVMSRQRGFPLKNKDAQKEALTNSLGMLLSEQAVENLSIKISPNHVDKQVQQLLASLPDYCFNPDGSLSDFFKKQIAPKTINDIVSDIAFEAEQKILWGIFDSTSYVPTFEMVLQYNTELSNKEYQYLTLSAQKYEAQVKKDKPTASALATFYKKAEIADQFRIGEKRAGKMWTFGPSAYGISVSDEDVKKDYDKNKAEKFVVTPAQMQVRLLVIKIEDGQDLKARERISELHQEATKNPEKFAELVKKFSEDKQSAAQGGLTELFDKDSKAYDQQVIDTAFTYLGTDGQISSPIKTDRGYEIVQRVKKVATKYQSFDSVASSIRSKMIEEKFKRRFLQDAARVTQQAKYNPDTLKSFIAKYNGKESILPLSGKQADSVALKLFGLEQGKSTSFMEKGEGVIIECNEIVKAEMPLLESVEPKVLHLYYQHQAHKMMVDLASQAVKMLSESPIEQVAAHFDTKVQKAHFSQKDGKNELSPILKETYVQSALSRLQYVGAATAASNDTQAVVLQLASIADLDPEIFKAQQSHMRQVASYVTKVHAQTGFIDSLYRTATLSGNVNIRL